MVIRMGLWLAMGAMGLAAPTQAEDSPISADPQQVNYAEPSAWLCRPDNNAVCATDLDATIVAADGSETVERWHADAHPRIDCFYVYPTVSADKQSNSDLHPAEDEEIAMTRQQFARFGAVCRVFAPVYRQVTVTVMRGEAPPGDRELAYHDVKAAWEDYLERDNQGRGVVLIGHSQGAGVLRRLIREEIDGKPAQQLVISALIIGGDVQVPKGKDVGGDFKSMPLCRSAKQIGCVIAYSMYRDTNPPDRTTRLGKSGGPGLVSACTNPARLGGGPAPLDAYLPTDFNTPPYHNQPSQTPQPPWVKNGKPVVTPYVKVPGLAYGECKQNQYANYLGVSIHSDPNQPRVHDIKGDIRIPGRTLGEFGLHLDDMLLPMGNLLTIVRRQTDMYLHNTAAASR